VEIVPKDEDHPNGRQIWMSDTKAEILEHVPLFNQLWQTETWPGKRILINGLGLGVAVHAALTYDGIGHIDVVEKDADVIELVGQYLTKDPRVTIHLGDAYHIRWPKGTKWDIAWHDIWPDISDGNLEGMNLLANKYRNRVTWQASWQEESCKRMADVMRRLKDKTLSADEAYEALLGRGLLA
jgi:spermidine synthase